MKRHTTYLMCVLGVLGLVLAVPTVSAGDADAIADLSKGITEWELLSEDNNAEPPKQANVYVSSSLGRMAPANTEEVPVVNGLAAFDGEWRPVQTAQDYWYARRDAALRSARPNNWVWQGIRATGYEVTGKYIQHFPLFNPLSIERHTVKVIDPMRQYTPAQRIGAGVGLSWDVASPFGKTMLKAGGTRLLKQQANAAAGAPNIPARPRFARPQPK